MSELNTSSSYVKCEAGIKSHPFSPRRMESINSEEFRQDLLRCLHGVDSLIKPLLLQNIGLAEVKEELKLKLGRLIQDHIDLIIDTAALKHEKQTDLPPANLLDKSVKQEYFEEDIKDEASSELPPPQPSEVDILMGEYGIKTEPITDDSDDSLTLHNKRPRQQLLPSDEMIEPRPLGQKRAKIYGIAENERRPFEFDAPKKPKSFGIKQTFGMKPLRFSLKENGEEYMIGSEVSFFKLEQSSI